MLITFEPSNQVLADKMTLHTTDGNDVGSVKITCYQDKGVSVETGFMNLLSGETITVGWNCEIIGEEVKVPAITLELLDSQSDDDTTATL